MNQNYTLRTRTAEQTLPADVAPERRARAAPGTEPLQPAEPRRSAEAPRSADPTLRAEPSEPRAASAARSEIVPVGHVDEAAASFALDRSAALARTEHSAAVRRLRLAWTIGLSVWIGSVLLDVTVTHISGEGTLQTLLLSRGISTLIGLAVLRRLYASPEPSVGRLIALDLLAFTTVAISVSINTLSYRGIDSPYAAGIICVLVARAATNLAPWRRGAWLFGLPALAYPVTVFAASALDARVAAQFHDRPALGAFISMTYMIAVCWGMLVIGSNFAWRLNREVMESRNIGRYKLERRLGSGGMGDVWCAFDSTLKQRVALKTVYGHRPGSSIVARFEREVRALAGLTHPNTVRIFDYGVTDDGLWYYAMELLHGETLRQLVHREGPLEPERLVHIARQVLRALGEAHHKGIIHRDIKPENVFVAELGGESDVVKLLDFGVAKAPASGDATLTVPGYVAGTPAYMAPEMILGRAGDVRSDIYSFGGMLYFAASGRLPFADRDPGLLLAAHLSRSPAPLSEVAPGTPAALEQIVLRCMEKDPADRFESTVALLAALQPIASAPPRHG